MGIAHEFAAAASDADLSGVVDWPVVVASVSLVGLAVAASLWLRLGIEWATVSASIRATVQLLAVGALFGAIFSSSRSHLLAWCWVVAMAVMASIVIRRRAAVAVPGLIPAAAAAVTLTTAVSLGTVFGFGVFEFDPVALVVVAGISIGNALPASVLGAKQSVSLARTRSGEIEALLSQGFDRSGAVQILARRASRVAITPQIERTKAVGLVALPGAMTGLLLAGVDPVDAVVVQLLVMLLVLGTVAISVVTVVVVITRAAITPRLTVAPWVRIPDRE